jgi:hypothetical protein
MEKHEEDSAKFVEQGEIQDIENRLASFREELNLHAVVDLRCVNSPCLSAVVVLTMSNYREKVSQFTFEQSAQFKNVDAMTRKILDTIINQQDQDALYT